MIIVIIMVPYKVNSFQFPLACAYSTALSSILFRVLLCLIHFFISATLDSDVKCKGGIKCSSCELSSFHLFSLVFSFPVDSFPLRLHVCVCLLCAYFLRRKVSCMKGSKREEFCHSVSFIGENLKEAETKNLIQFRLYSVISHFHIYNVDLPLLHLRFRLSIPLLRSFAITHTWYVSGMELSVLRTL